MYKRIINDELIERFKPLVGTYSFREIGIMLGVSTAVVFKMSCITGIKPTEEQKLANKRRVQSYNLNVERFLELADSHSYSEIADIMGCTLSCVKYYAKRANYKRTKSQCSELLSKSMLKMNERERRRMKFGLEQNTNKRLVIDQRLSVRKQKYRNWFRHYGYKVDWGSNSVFIPKGLKRHIIMEGNAKALGFKLIEAA